MNIKKAVMFWGVVMGITSLIVMTGTFMYAYFSPNQEVLVTVNSIGEANLEFVLFLTSPIAVVGLWMFLTRLGDGVLDD